MRRRKPSSDDPLDLLLDTICNLFGVMIFVAIVAAILVGPPSRPSDQRPLDRTTDPSDHILEIVTPDPRLISADIQISAAQEEIEFRAEQLSEMQELRRRISSNLATAAEYGSWLRAEVEDLELELKLETEKKDITLRTPRQRQLMEMVPVQVVVTRGRVYVVNDWSALVDSDPISERCVGWTTWNTSAVDPSRSRYVLHKPCLGAGGQDLERWILLRSDGGVLVGSPTQFHADPTWIREISWFDKDHFIINIKVASDSFEQYGTVRADVASRGLHYDVEIVPDGLLYQDRLLEGLATTQ